MLDPPAAQRAQKKHLGKAFLTGKLGGIFGVGVILDVRQDDDIVVLLHRTGRGIEIPQDDIGLAAQRRAVAVASITGDDEVIGAEQTLQLRRDRAGREDHAAHHIPLLCQSLTSLTSSYMAQ